MIEKKDWEFILKQNEDQRDKVIKDYELFLPQVLAIIKLAQKKIAEFPDEEKEDMPEDIKNMLK